MSNQGSNAAVRLLLLWGKQGLVGTTVQKASERAVMMRYIFAACVRADGMGDIAKIGRCYYVYSADFYEGSSRFWKRKDRERERGIKGEGRCASQVLFFSSSQERDATPLLSKVFFFFLVVETRASRACLDPPSCFSAGHPCPISRPGLGWVALETPATALQSAAPI